MLVAGGEVRRIRERCGEGLTKNEQRCARFQCWWAQNLTMPPQHHPPSSKTCLFLVVVGSAPHHPTSSKTSISLLIFDGSGLRTSHPVHHLTTPAYACSFSLVVYLF